MAPTTDDPDGKTSGWQESPRSIEGRGPGIRGDTENRILVVDKHGVYRKGLRSLIEASIPHSKVFEANDLAAASTVFESEKYFDLILIDFSELGGRSRKSLQDAFGLSPTTRFAVVSTSRARDDILSSLAAGFHGFVLKLQPDEDIIAAITDMLAGRIYVPRWLADSAEERHEFTSAPRIRDDISALTPRQREVLSLVALGLSNKEIAYELHISEGTTKVHTAALLRALGARNRTEAVFKAANLAESRERHATGGPAPIRQARERGRIFPMPPPSYRPH